MDPDELQEADTDLSSVLKMNGHVETIQKIFDVVKKTANGVEFIIWGLENQEKIHYAMPLRHMLNDSLAYLKECNEISAKHRKERRWICVKRWRHWNKEDLNPGKKELLKEKVGKKLAKGKTVVIIADELEEEPEVIQRIVNEIQESGMEK